MMRASGAASRSNHVVAPLFIPDSTMSLGCSLRTVNHSINWWWNPMPPLFDFNGRRFHTSKNLCISRFIDSRSIDRDLRTPSGSHSRTTFSALSGSEDSSFALKVERLGRTSNTERVVDSDIHLMNTVSSRIAGAKIRMGLTPPRNLFIEKCPSCRLLAAQITNLKSETAQIYPANSSQLIATRLKKLYHAKVRARHDSDSIKQNESSSSQCKINTRRSGARQRSNLIHSLSESIDHSTDTLDWILVIENGTGSDPTKTPKSPPARGRLLLIDSAVPQI
jgi:hypothetical protein